MRILIVGAGKSGAYLAFRLSKSNDVIVVDQRRGPLDRLVAWVPDIQVVHGDACEPTMLEHAGVSDADLVVAATGDDEDNLVVSWLAKDQGVPTVIARVNHPANGWLFTEKWGVDLALSPPALMARAVLEKALPPRSDSQDRGATASERPSSDTARRPL